VCYLLLEGPREGPHVDALVDLLPHLDAVCDPPGNDDDNDDDEEGAVSWLLGREGTQRKSNEQIIERYRPIII
jgi:hypothetical protein